jgi:hypothetical protein
MLHLKEFGGSLSVDAISKKKRDSNYWISIETIVF